MLVGLVVVVSEIDCGWDAEEMDYKKLFVISSKSNAENGRNDSCVYSEMKIVNSITSSYEEYKMLDGIRYEIDLRNYQEAINKSIIDHRNESSKIRFRNIGIFYLDPFRFEVRFVLLYNRPFIFVCEEFECENA